MPTLPEVMVTLLLPFEPLFDPGTWRKAQLLTVGAILSPGKRTVSSVLNILGVGQRGDFTTFHHVLNRARSQPCPMVPTASEPGIVVLVAPPAVSPCRAVGFRD